MSYMVRKGTHVTFIKILGEYHSNPFHSNDDTESGKQKTQANFTQFIARSGFGLVGLISDSGLLITPHHATSIGHLVDWNILYCI